MYAWKAYMITKTNTNSVWTESQVEQIESDPKTRISYYLQPQKRPELLTLLPNTWMNSVKVPTVPVARHTKSKTQTVDTPEVTVVRHAKSKSQTVTNTPLMWYHTFPSVLFHMIASYLDPISGYKMLNMFKMQLSEFGLLAQTLCSINLDDIRSDLECKWITTMLLTLDYFPLGRRLLIVFLIECYFLYPNGIKKADLQDKSCLYMAASLRDSTAIEALILSFTETVNHRFKQISNSTMSDMIQWANIWADQCKSNSAREFIIHVKNQIAKHGNDAHNGNGKLRKSVIATHTLQTTPVVTTQKSETVPAVESHTQSKTVHVHKSSNPMVETMMHKSETIPVITVRKSKAVAIAAVGESVTISVAESHKRMVTYFYDDMIWLLQLD